MELIRETLEDMDKEVEDEHLKKLLFSWWKRNLKWETRSGEEEKSEIGIKGWTVMKRYNKTLRKHKHNVY